jgi:hypothetical protein
MYRIAIGLVATAFLASAGSISGVVASVSSSEAFSLNGHYIPASGVPSWPLVGGDVISTANAPAVVSLGNAGNVLVQPNSRVRIASAGTQAKLLVLAGHTRREEEDHDGDRDDHHHKPPHHKPPKKSQHCDGDDDRDHKGYGNSYGHHDRDDRECGED